MSVSFADVIDMFVGQSERNIHELFSIARRHAPCVLFLDEVDALGQKRSQLRNTPMRSAVNQLLLELDDVTAGNDGGLPAGRDQPSVGRGQRAAQAGAFRPHLAGAAARPGRA